MSENINDLIKLPVLFDDETTYAHKWIFDAKGETVARIVNGEQSEKKIIGEFIAQAINSYAANQERIKELEAESVLWRTVCRAIDEGVVSVILENADTSIDGGEIVTNIDEVIEHIGEIND
jgi:hypothetical protein